MKKTPIPLIQKTLNKPSLMVAEVQSTMRPLNVGVAILWLLMALAPLKGWGQMIKEQTNAQNIKSVQLFRDGWELSEPVIMLGSEERLILSFDDLSTESQPYHFSIVHLSGNDEPSLLTPSEYVTGFPHQPIDDYSFSFNTTRSYVHYQISFPNRDMTILRSGKYALLVYLNYDSEHPVFVRHFFVSEQSVGIDPSIRIPTSGMYKESHQQLNIKVLHPGVAIKNPLQDARLVVRQNGRRDNMQTNLKPDFIRADELVYDYQDAMRFVGGNEFRWLDIRSTAFIAENIGKVVFANPYYHEILKTDEIKWDKPFFERDDSNGQYIISVREYDDAAVNADYVFVHFSLLVTTPFPKGNMYVLGGLTDWEMNQSNQMTYNFETSCYELTLLLKQGFYNYQYAFMENGKTKADLSMTEGNHMPTENSYHVFFYHRSPSDNYDRLLGYWMISTGKAKSNGNNDIIHKLISK
jgi:hypothetical protein